MENEIRIKDLYHYREFISDKVDNFLFRGVEDIDYKLIPKIGRLFEGFVVDEETRKRIETEIFLNFTLKATEYQDLPDKAMYTLALAQHHGLATRLLDWTTDPFVALYFALKQTGYNSINKPSVVYAYKHSFNIKTKALIEEDGETYMSEVGEGIINTPRYPRDFFFLPPIVSPRISAQSGILQAFPDPTKPFDDDTIVKLIIEGEGLKQKIRGSLNLYGYNEHRLFPTIDNLCNFLNENNKELNNLKLNKADCNKSIVDSVSRGEN